MHEMIRFRSVNSPNIPKFLFTVLADVFVLIAVADEDLVGLYDDIMKLKKADDDFIKEAYGDADEAFKRGGVGSTQNKTVERANPIYDALNVCCCSFSVRAHNSSSSLAGR